MKVFFASLFSAACITAFAQNEQDALRYSQTSFGGTARYSAMAGAMGAVGADMSVLSTNPAGIGFYRKNELTFTPSLFSQNVTSTYNDSVSEDSRYNLRFNNFGFVFAGPTENKEATGWQSVGMGIAYNRYNTFQANLWMTGKSNTSMMDSWAKTAGGTGPSNLDAFNEGLAWNTWLLNNAIGDTMHYTDTIPAGDLLYQEKMITMRGGMGEWLFSFGGNYSNKLFLGASIGVPQVRYEESSTYTEQEVVDTTSDFDYLRFDQTLVTKGRGINFKVGVIYRPADLFRIGFAFHSPTFLKLNDAYSSSMTSVIGGYQRNNESPNGTFQYTIRTPARAIASLAFIFGKTAMVSADYEVTDYSEAHISSQTYEFATANNAIRAKYNLGQNIRVGGEFRYLPFIFRAGLAWYGSPYNATVNNNAARLLITGGAGYHTEDDSFYIDFALISTHEQTNYYFYDQSLVNPVSNKWKSIDAMMTLGFHF